jgi:hypothetical protein
MKVSESRWRVGRVVHIYNPAYSLTHLDHHGRTTPPLHPLVHHRSTKKRNYTCPSHGTLFCCKHPRHINVTSSHHHHSGDMYTHILIHRYYHNRSSATLDFIAFW